MAVETDWARVTGREFLFVSHTLATGGIESLLVRMTNALVRDGHDVTLIAPTGPMAAYLESRVRWMQAAGL